MQYVLDDILFELANGDVCPSSTIGPLLTALHHHSLDYHEDRNPLQIMDLQNLLTHDYMNENKLLEEACKYWSLFRLVNHGVPSTLLTKLHDQAKQFFSLSFESKQASCSANPVTYFWGTPAPTPSDQA
ncbi:hypothetical protein JHK87_004959 [Glycine soja]|nr:hypothetical protein JHK87_004959 [Glycine soja]